MARFEFPVYYFERNLVFGRDKVVHAYYELDPFHYDFRSLDEQLLLHGNIESFFWSIQARTHILIVPQFQYATEIYRSFLPNIMDDLLEVGKKHISTTLQQLEGSEIHRYRFFIGIELPSKVSLLNSTLLKELSYLARDFKRYLLSQSGIEPEDILEEELQAFQIHEEQVFSRISSYFKVKRVSEQDIEWLIRRGFYRGVGQTPLRKEYTPHATVIEVSGRKARRPSANIITLSEGQINDSFGRHLTSIQFVDGMEKEGYMSFLTISYIPDKSPFPGTEWLYCLHLLPFPVEVSMRTQTIEYSRALTQVLNKRKELKAEDEHALESGEETAYHIMHSRQEANELENDLRKDKFPLLYTSTILGVSATSLDELHLRVQLVKDLYSDMMIQVEVPYGDQWLAFNDFLPGGKRTISDYCHYMEPAAVAASMCLATRELGDPTGHLIGKSKNIPVFFQHDRGPKDKTVSSTASAAFIGSLGAGKSLGANFLVYQALLTGARVLIFDPKDERGHWPEVLPELKGITRTVTLRASSNDRGKLDPLIGAVNKSDKVEAAETVKRILQFLARAGDGTYEAITIGKAVDKVVTLKNPSMMKVLQHLKAGISSTPEKRKDSLEEMVDVLYYLASSGQGQLLFGDGSHQAIDLTHPLTILQIENLKLPEENQTDYGRMATALLMAISDFSRRFSNQSSDHFKIVLFDESWRLAKVPEGRAVLEELIRTGRSKNAAIYLISQNAKDLLGEEIRSNIGCRFVFRCRDEKEAVAACHILGIEPTENHTQLIRSLPTGTCLFSDLEKRVNELKICVENRLLDAFDTRPGSRLKTAEVIAEGDLLYETT